MNAAHKLIESHLVEGKMEPGSEIGIRIDQVLQQDATGTLVMLELEAIGLEKTKAQVAVQYVQSSRAYGTVWKARQNIAWKRQSHLFRRSHGHAGHWNGRIGCSDGLSG